MSTNPQPLKLGNKVSAADAVRAIVEGHTPENFSAIDFSKMDKVLAGLLLSIVSSAIRSHLKSLK